MVCHESLAVCFENGFFIVRIIQTRILSFSAAFMNKKKWKELRTPSGLPSGGHFSEAGEPSRPFTAQYYVIHHRLSFVTYFYHYRYRYDMNTHAHRQICERPYLHLLTIFLSSSLRFLRSSSRRWRPCTRSADIVWAVLATCLRCPSATAEPRHRWIWSRTRSFCRHPINNTRHHNTLLLSDNRAVRTR